MKETSTSQSYWNSLWIRFKRHKLGFYAYYTVLLFAFVGIFAPFLASGKPFCVYYNSAWYFPLFRYLFYTGYYTKNIDIFFNLLIFTLPAGWLLWKLLRKHKGIRKGLISALMILQMGVFAYIILSPRKDPGSDPALTHQRQLALKHHPLPSWDFDLSYMNEYAKLNLLLKQQQYYIQNQQWLTYEPAYLEYVKGKGGRQHIPSYWENQRQHELEEIERQNAVLKKEPPDSEAYKYAEAKIKFVNDRRQWIQENLSRLKYEVLPPVRYFHWEEDAGGDQSLNQFLPWWELTRSNGKDLLSGLIFGVRISLTVGILSIAIALFIGIPIGAFAGYYGGTFDIIVSRMLEIWESMPTFFMLLFVVAILQSKTIFLVILVIGLFGWTGFSRYIRGEFFKQRNLTYVEACQAIGFNDRFIIFSHILPNAIPPVLTLLPFAVMGAISSEAGLSFLGLGEEGSCSWGVLMDEGRRAFPGETNLLWPPAILLTLLLVAIALVGDALRDALDPKL